VEAILPTTKVFMVQSLFSRKSLNYNRKNFLLFRKLEKQLANIFERLHYWNWPKLIYNVPRKIYCNLQKLSS